MANQFLKPEIIAAVALERLRRELILPRLVRRMGIADFRGAKDDTVNVRVPAVLNAREYEFRTRNNPIVLDSIEEQSVPVTLDKHPYSAVAVTDEELTLDIASFAQQVLEPQVIGVAEKLESYLADVMVNADFADGPVQYVEDSNSAGANFHKAAVDARKILNDRHIPTNGRVIALGSSVEAAVLKEEGFRRVNESGSTEVLRNAVIGNVAGFTVVGNVQSLPPDFAIAFHASAFVFANVAPLVPAGVTFGQSVSQDNLAVRWIRDYDPNFLRDRSVVSAFAGAASVNDLRDSHGALVTGDDAANIRAVRIAFTPSGS